MAQSTARPASRPIRLRPRSAQATARTPLPQAPLPGPRRGGLPSTATIPGASGSTPPGSPWASSSPRSSPTTTPAMRPSIASRSPATTRDSPRSPPRRPATARPANACPRSSLWDLVRRTGRSIHREGRAGLALPRPGGQDRRRLHRDHARHPGEPGGVPPAEHPGARRGVPDRPHPRGLQPGRGHGARGRDRARTRASRPASWPCSGRSSTQFQPGDIVLADRFFCSYWVIAALQGRGVDVVVRLHQRRRGRLPPRPAAGPGGPPRHLDEAASRSPTG